EKSTRRVPYAGKSKASATGSVRSTVGGVVSGAGRVTKVQAKGAARTLPARSFTPALVTVYAVPAASGADGWKVTAGPESVTRPATGTAPAATVTAAVVTVAGSTASEKTALTAAVVATPVEPSSGATVTTAGGVVSGGLAVVKAKT